MDNLKEQLEKDGYVILRDLFLEETIENIKITAQNVFEIQFTYFGYTGTFKEKAIKLFKEQNEVFKNCGKLIQTGLPSLYQLAVNEGLLNWVSSLGDIPNPIMCTRPVLYFNHPELAKSKEYYMTPTHQDWSSMRSSLNSLIVWIPLVDVDDQNGSIIIYPGSHKLGILDWKSEGGFAKVEKPNIEPIQPKLKVGDVAIFSSLLVHESGKIKDDSIRFSCHFRYTDINNLEYIERGFENPYQYIPITKKPASR